jgi:hypothetical protein
MAKGFEISEVRLPANGGYVVVTRLKEHDIEAMFEVALSARRRRRGLSRELKHHRKTFEMLEGEARSKVAALCRNLAEALAKGAPQN